MPEKRALRFSLIPPIGWKELDLAPDRREGQISDAIKGLRDVTPDWDTVYPVLRRQFIGAYEQAWNSGIRYAITTVPDSDQPVQIVATYMIAILPSAGVDGDELSFIADSLLTERETLSDDESLDIAKVTLGELGTAIQADGVRLVSKKNTKNKAYMASRRLFIPALGRVVLAIGYTPQTDIKDILFELFSQITQTLQVWEESDDAMTGKDEDDGKL